MIANEYGVARDGPSPRIVTCGLRKRTIGYYGGDASATNWLTGIIDGSDDAIVSKNLNGIIQSWNDGATRLFGYSADEAIGKPLAILTPEDRLHEEPTILAQIWRGRRVGPFETKRLRKDGSLVDISLTLSFIRNKDGIIVGASKIARDITGALMAREQQQLLIDEMRHRMKNLFSLAAAIVSTSARSFASESNVIDDIRARLLSLARAHEITMTDRSRDEGNWQTSSLLTLIGRILNPYASAGRITIRGNDCDVGGRAVTYLSLLLYELATNAAKCGSLSVGSGQLGVSVAADGDQVRLVWRETGGPVPSAGLAGFGSRLERSVMVALNATIERDWRLTGLVATITIPKRVLIA